MHPHDFIDDGGEHAALIFDVHPCELPVRIQLEEGEALAVVCLIFLYVGGVP